MSFADFKDWREQTTAFSAAGGLPGAQPDHRGRGTEPERLSGRRRHVRSLRLLGTPPALGRDFGPDDDRAGAEPVVLLSDDVWQEALQRGSEASSAAPISINGRPHTVIGVMPEGFKFPETQRCGCHWRRTRRESRRDARNNQMLRAIEAGRDDATGARRSRKRAARLGGGLSRLKTRGGARSSAPLREWMLPGNRWS